MKSLRIQMRFIQGVVFGVIFSTLSYIILNFLNDFEDRKLDYFLNDIGTALAIYYGSYGRYPDFSSIDQLVKQLEGQNPKNLLIYQRPTDSVVKEFIERRISSGLIGTGIINNRIFFFFDSGEDDCWNTGDDYTFFYEL